MEQTFGRKLRAERKRSGKTMAVVASHLGFSVPYLSDIERDRRNPPARELVEKIAVLLECPPADLLEAAAVTRGSCELDLSDSVSNEARAVATAMWRQWPLSSQQLTEIEKVLKKGESKK